MPDEKTIAITIDGQKTEAEDGATIWEAAQSMGVDIPRLCHQPGMEPVGVCRVCAVEVEGARTLVPSCHRKIEPGMVIQTGSERVVRAQKTLVAMLMADHGVQSESANCELTALAEQLEAENGVSALPPKETGRAQDFSSAVIAVDHSACILCDRCIRACTDVQGNNVIGRGGKGASAGIVFDTDLPMGESTCVSCGECMAACPTDALTNKSLTLQIVPARTKEVDSVCPYCGVGCSITYQVAGNTLLSVRGDETSPVNQGRLCVKGRYGFDYAHHPERLTTPLIRKEGAPKTKELPGNPLSLFREAGWEEALDLAANSLQKIHEAHGPSGLAGFGSAKCSNEDNYLFQKLIRAGFGTNNVDHCTRLCHASSVAALFQTIGSGAVSNPFSDALKADFILVAGANATENHPVAATFIKQAASAGAALAVIDPRRIDLVDHADMFVQFRPGTDVALFNGLLNVVITEKRYDADFVAARTEGFEELAENVKPYTPENVAKLTGVPAEALRELARRYAASARSIIFWGMGLSQHTHGTDNCRALIALCLICGQIGREGTGLHPLRGQNNVQGASDVGLIPMVYSGYQDVASPRIRRKFEKAWGRKLDPEPGLTVMEIADAAIRGEVKGMYIMGENPAMSDPNLNHSRGALANLEFLVVQDIFLTETAYFADVVLPSTAFPEKTGTYTNTDRRVQIGRRAIDPPGEAREDWRIVAELSERLGYPMEYDSEAEIFDEIASLTPFMAGMSYDRLGAHGLVWPCTKPDRPGREVLFEKSFPSGRGKLIPVQYAPARELPDDDYPFVLNTGRNIYHWHTGAITRRAQALEAAEPGPYVEMAPEDIKRLKIKDGSDVVVESRRGEITLPARASARGRPGQVFIPFHYVEAAANLLTVDDLDPYGKIPEFKFCAVRVKKARKRRT
ncbi:MAG: formate dehydrogenase subunit alpha [Nitrospinae bacterium]|nr:formate dehydrogenase subunit alpha [Nitrospinota bacterium]